jgi:hypothetical protein
MGGGFEASKRWFYVDTRSLTPNPWTYPLTAGKSPQQLMHFISGRIFGISLSPDGTKIAFSLGSINSDVVLFSGNAKSSLNQEASG